MKHSLPLKFIIVLLTACSLVSAIAGGAGIVAMENAGLYVNDVSLLQDREYGTISRSIANAYANLYALDAYGDIPYLMRQELYSDPAARSDADHWHVRIVADNKLLAEEGVSSGAMAKHSFAKSYTIAPLYPIASLYAPGEIIPEPSEPETDPTEPTETAPTIPSIEGEVIVPAGYLYVKEETLWEGIRPTTYYLYYYQAPEYTVTVYLQEQVLENSSLQILTDMFPYRYAFIAILAVGLLLFASGIVYLCWSVGKSADGSIRPGGPNRLPLDLYALIAGVGIWLLILLFNNLRRWIDNEGPHPGNLSLIFVDLLAVTLIGIGFFLAFCAQIKVGRGHWYRNTILGWFLRKLWQGCVFLCNGVKVLIAFLPLMWQWILAVVISVGSLCVLTAAASHLGGIYILLTVLDFLLCLGILLYIGYAYGTLIKGAKRMSGGDLVHKVPTKHLRGSFLDFADQLNSLADTAVLAAENEMRSERMKSELITNVSHDIKTPLTSIINFVDLLQKPHSPEESAAYLEVLSRQSARMKKLIEDLMELSKASSGNITVNISTLDAVETVNQALGEFSDKLDSVGLEPVFTHPDTGIAMQADGRLVWRVLSNLLSNAVKYAMPGTRLYVDLLQAEDQVLLSLKNVSQKPLNISSQDLMERFVRGDVSRNSEGSGLGLNIAKSLMEVQNGHLELLLDGDLFKVTLIFPAG